MFRLFSKKQEEPQKDTRPHFVRDYEALVDRLVADKTYDEAMQVAVGGCYEQFGNAERDALVWAGLKDGMSVLDFGCGSGRLGAVLGKTFSSLDYTGIDIVQRLLDYAKAHCPQNYRFIRSQSYTIPAEDNSADFVACFSVFTHLLPSENYLYLDEIKRILRPNGRLVMSFLEFALPRHWEHFASVVHGHTTTLDHLNTMMERPVIDLFCEKLGLVREAFFDGANVPWGGDFGQSVAIIRKP